MQVGTRKYILRFGLDSKKDMLVTFRDDETLRDNLMRVIPKAIDQGFLPKSCSADHMEVDYKERTLVLDQPMRGQNVPDCAILVMRDVSSLIKIKVRLKPDASPAVIETVVVKSDQVLKGELSGFADKIRSSYRFYGRKVKNFNLVLGRKKLDLSMTLRAQQVKKDIDVVFKPRVWFEWPPRLLWPPGPFTTYMLAGIAVLAIITLLHFHRTEFVVDLVSKEPQCIFVDSEGHKLSPSALEGRRMRAGTNDSIVVYPEKMPMFTLFDHPLRARFAWSNRLEFSVDSIINARFGSERDVAVAFQVVVPDSNSDERISEEKFRSFTFVVNGFQYEDSTDMYNAYETQLRAGRYVIVCVPRVDVSIKKMIGNIKSLNDSVFVIGPPDFTKKDIVMYKYDKYQRQ